MYCAFNEKQTMETKQLLIVVVFLLSMPYSQCGILENEMPRNVYPKELSEGSASVTNDPPPADRRAEIKEIVGRGMWPVYVMYTTFVADAVQLQHLYQLDERVNMQSFEAIGENIDDEWQEYAKYFVGFLVCVAVGVVALLAMIVSGIVIPCCRCCGKCGGKKVDPMDTKKSHRQRLGCSISLFIFNLILVLGVVVVCVTNIRVRDQLEGDTNIFDRVSNTADQIKPYLTDSVNEMNVSVLQQYITTKDDIFDILEDIPTDALTAFDRETLLLQTYGELQKFADDLGSLKNALEEADINSAALQTNVSFLRTSLSSVKDDIVSILDTCLTPGCEVVRNKTNDLDINVDYTIVNVSSAADLVDFAISNGFVEFITAIGGNITMISNEINTTTNSEIKEARIMADDIQGEIAGVIRDIEKQVNDLDISQLNEYMEEGKKVMDEQNIPEIVYWSVVVIPTTLCVIIFTNLMGLLHGAACPRPKPSDNCLDCNTTQGTRWLYASIAFTFIFYWIYMIIVVVTFTVGGSIYTELCNNVIHFNNDDSVRSLNVWDRLINSSLADENFNIAVFDTYRRCERNEALYTALRLAENGYNVSQYLNLTGVEKAIEDIKSQPIDIPDVDIYNTDIDEILGMLDSGIFLNYQDMVVELDKSITTVDVQALIGELSALNVSELIGNITILQGLENDLLKPMRTAANETKTDLNRVMVILKGLNFTTIGQTLENAETFIRDDGDELASRYVNQTADAVFSNITTLADTVVHDIENNVAQCRPLYRTATELVDTACVHAMFPVNALWFSLGWCIFFLIPHLILSFKLSKLLRKSIPYNENFSDVNFPEEMLLERVHNTTDDFPTFDNLTFDPMEAYRKEVAKNGLLNSEKPSTDPPPYPKAQASNEPFSYIIPRPNIIKAGLLPEKAVPPHYGAVTDFNGHIPRPSYGLVGEGDASEAQLY